MFARRKSGVASGGALEPEVSAINAQWTVRLRFGSFLGQIGTIAVVHFGMGIEVPLLPLFALVALGLLTNIVARWHLLRRGGAPNWMLPALLAFDVALLTALLYLTGGPMNPFSVMYLVIIALATVVLPPRATWGLVALSLIGSGVLFLWHRSLDWHGLSGQGDPMRIHLQGMWVAFGVAASFIVYFLLRIRRALGQREAELEAARNLAARRDKLASLATLAAGAAHELATPLGTIAVAATELDRQLRSGPLHDAALEDVKLIRAQVARCRSVLQQLARDSGAPGGEELALTSPAELIRVVQEELPSERLQVTMAAGSDSPRLRLPLRSLAQALRSLVGNALEAAPIESPVELRVGRSENAILIEVLDRGPGMSAETLRRIGEPFFTTKAPGQGMGLGVFLCRAVVESLAGQLTFQSSRSAGTRATVTLPLRGIEAAPASLHDSPLSSAPDGARRAA